MLRRAHTYDPARGKPTTWASWLCRSVADTMRRRALASDEFRDRYRVLFDEATFDDLLASVERVDELNHDRERLDEGLALLAEDEREAVQAMRRGETAGSYARAVQRSPERIRKAMSNGRARLREMAGA